MRNGTKLLLCMLTLVILLVITLVSQLPEKDLTKLNPWIPKQIYYVQVHNASSNTPSSQDTSVEYTLPAWDDKGNPQTVTFFGIHSLREGAYLQLTLKNQQVLSYKEISYDQIPTVVQSYLRR